MWVTSRGDGLVVGNRVYYVYRSGVKTERLYSLTNSLYDYSRNTENTKRRVTGKCERPKETEVGTYLGGGCL